MKDNRPPSESRNWPRRILLIRLGAIGDVLLTTPLIRMLVMQYPASEIDFLVKNAYVSLLESNSRINRLYVLARAGGFGEIHRMIRLIRGRHYDAVIDLQGNFRSRLISFFSGARTRSRAHLGRWKRFLLVHFKRNVYGDAVPVPVKFIRAAPFPIQDDGKGLDFDVPRDAEKRILTALKLSGRLEKDRMVALAPGAGRATKQWPAERFAEVGQFFSKQDYKVVLIGGEKDAEICKIVRQRIRPVPWDFSGKLSLIETAALIRQVDLLVTNDTGVMHIASAVETRTVALFGPTTRHFGFQPFRSNALVIEKELACRPCSYHGTERCPQKHFRCMRDISSEEVMNLALNFLNSR